MIKYLSLILLVLASCGAGPLRTAQIDPIFQPYVDIFNKAAADRNLPISADENTGIIIRWSDTMPKAAATCHFEVINTLYTPIIDVDRNYWKSSYIGASNRETLVLHELGHCILKRLHDDESPYRGRQHKSIMFYMNGIDDYVEYKEAYLDELFGVEK